jgi:hypothetical protein
MQLTDIAWLEIIIGIAIGIVIGRLSIYIGKENNSEDIEKRIVGAVILIVYGFVMFRGLEPGTWLNFFVGIVLAHFLGWESLKKAIARRIGGSSETKN